ncbi:hypothetical protein TTHERM_00470420 (macronuclear) [Tetrahymena thermophila SB210]|uniref:Uncharacterized protein n=1 Tax=Tetrahymena thermophila (strain SB210) TaxID=312017 RepID=I7M6I5_TETTS|nr:hypothetical protein TTHERM_00470420 [Tetrahymena thermophila SB210]EAR85269.2 hypothetical protein TTHERM_00470420 [Tetrahymena thermophila SB210]|eukprot:XP_001032932.2 hypothetical protein TTHERM_00470420 [Tetrahymena thermophila SB210]
MINDIENNNMSDDSKDQIPSQFSIRKKAKTTIDINLQKQTESKLQNRQPSAKDYLNVLPDLEMEDQLSSKIRFQINSDISNELSSKAIQKESTNKSHKLKQIPKINITHIQENKHNQNASFEYLKSVSPLLQTRQKCYSFSQNQKYLQSPLLKQKSKSKTPNKRDVSENEQQFFSQNAQKQPITLDDSKKKKLINETSKDKNQQEKNIKDSQDAKNKALYKKAQSRFNLQNLIDFHSKWQLLKNIRNKPFRNSNNNIESIEENISQEQDDVRKSSQDLDNENAQIEQQLLQNNYLDEIQEKGQMENLEEGLAQRKQNSNHLANKLRQTHKKKFQQEGYSDFSQSSQYYKSDGLKLSDYFFVGSQNSNQKSQQVRLNLSQESENNRKPSKLINIFKTEFDGSQTQKSHRFSQENHMSDNMGFKSNMNFNSSIQKQNQNQEISVQLSKQQNYSQNIQLGLTNVFSASLEQSVILNKKQSEVKGLLSPKKDKTNQNYDFKESSPVPTKRSVSPQFIQSRGKSSEQSITESRMSANDISNKMIDDELQFQRKRRQQSPLNYLFKKYPDAIKDTKYSYMKMQMRQVVENHIAPELSAEKKLTEKYESYSQNLNTKLRNKLVKQSSNKIDPHNSKLISLKSCFSNQQRKTFSQINQLICDVEVAKKQYKFIDYHLSKFNKTINDIDDTAVQSSYFNVSDFIYKTQINNRNKQNQIISHNNQNKRLMTE